jgi:small subunit ribosomal protein S12e
MLTKHYLFNLGLVKGLNQVGKSLDRADAFLCVLAEDCDDPKYKKLITALAKQNKIPLITVASRMDLGEWTGQCKYEKSTEKDKETGKARKVKGCSSLCIRDYGEESDAKTLLEEHIKEHNL